MDNYIVSARKYRPSTFANVIGQKALTATLKNAIATDRLAHAYLFCGSRGVGKTSCARIFAKTINCQHPTPDGDPCNQCDSCRAFNENRSMNIIELDAASNNSVDDIRQLVDQVQVPPVNGKYRVFIVDEVHMLSAQAFNAFLKTLEEPPSYVVFILATTEKQKIIPTILSRCQIYDFSRITVSDMVDHLEFVASQEGITTERAALNIIAQKADGAMRDALSIFDQVAASSRGNITYASAIANLNVLDSAYYNRLMDAFIASDVPQALLIYKEVRDHGFDSHFFINGLASYLRDLMVARDPQTLSLLDTDAAIKEQMAEVAKRVPTEFFFKAMSLCNDADLNYRQASSKTFLVELLLIKLCQLLSPSHIFDGNGEGQLKPIAVTAPATPTPSTPTPAASQSQPQQPARTAPQTTQTVAYTQHTERQPLRPVAPPPAPGSGVRRTLQSTHARMRQEPAPTEQQPQAERQMRNATYTDSNVLEAWNSFARTHTTEHILINTMRMSRPTRVSGDLFDVTVESEVQVDNLEQFRGAIVQHICDAIGNDSFNFRVSVNQSGPSPRTWNDREIYDHLIEDTEISRFVEAFGLRLE